MRKNWTTRQTSDPVPYFEAGRVKRTQRHPQYTDAEMGAFFEAVSEGYTFEQAAERCKYPFEWVLNTLNSDDETMDWALHLSMVAGARIRMGELPVPDRWDDLYKQGG